MVISTEQYLPRYLPRYIISRYVDMKRNEHKSPKIIACYYNTNT